jgi:flagellar basal body rod protein FlgB
MNLPATATDNISEVLLKIIEFTQSRQKILIQNINAMHTTGFVPRDLAVDEFSRLMEQAVSEHAASRRLLLQDGANIKFGVCGSFEVIPVIDENAKSLLEQNRDEYLRWQISKLLENSINQRIAVEMLKQMKANGQLTGRYLN